MGAYNAGGVHWQLITFQLGKPGIMAILDPFSVNVKMCNMTNSIEDMDAEFMFCTMQHARYAMPPVISTSMQENSGEK
eukprot:4061051-Ditylum_brightwellii.AAC.1